MYLGIERFKDKDYLVNKRGDLCLFYKVNFPPIFSMSEEKMFEVNNAFSKALNMLGSDMILQRIDFTYKKSNIYEKQMEITSEEYEKNFYEKIPFKKIESYFVFIKKANPSKKLTYVDSLVQTLKNKDRLFEQKHYDEKSINDFNISIYNFFDILKRGLTKNFSFKNLVAQEIKNIVQNKYFNLNISKDIYGSTINNIIDKEEYIQSSNKCAYIYNITELPKTLNAFEDAKYNSVYGSMPISFQHDLYYYTNNDLIIISVYEGIDNNKYKSELKNKKNIANGIKFGSESNERISNSLDLLYSYMDANKEDKIMNYQLGIISIKEKNESEEKKQFSLNSLKNTLLNYGYGVEDASGIPLIKFINFSPGNVCEIPEEVKIKCPTSILSQMTCFEHSTLNTSSIGVPMMDVKSKEYFNFNIYKYTTKHFAVFGPTGTGKSFTMNHIMKNILTSGSEFVIADVGYSYKKLCEYYGGDYIEMSNTNPLKMNPFLVFRKDKNGSFIINSTELDEEDDAMGFVLNLLMVCYKGSDNTEITTVEKTYINTLIRDYMVVVNESTKQPSFTEFYNKIDTLIEKNKNLQVTDSVFNINKFKLIMSQFVVGNEYGHIFDTNENFDLIKSKFVVFEFEKIRQNKTLFPISYFILTSMVLTKIYTKKSKRPFFLVFDEVHLLLSGEYGRTDKFIDYCIRTMRKWDAGLGLSTQNINDLNKSPELKGSLVNNTSLFYFKKQPTAQKDFIQQNLEMSDFNINKLFSIQDQYKEIFVYDKNNDGHIMRIETSTYNYWLYTTDGDDKKVYEEYYNRYNKDIKLTLKMLVENNALEEVKVIKEHRDREKK